MTCPDQSATSYKRETKSYLYLYLWEGNRQQATAPASEYGQLVVFLFLRFNANCKLSLSRRPSKRSSKNDDHLLHPVEGADVVERLDRR